MPTSMTTPPCQPVLSNSQSVPFHTAAVLFAEISEYPGTGRCDWLVDWTTTMLHELVFRSADGVH